MLAHALRRLLWTIPALIGVSIVTFLFLSYVPDPTDDPAFAARAPRVEIDRLRRERFLDLPRFVNLAPGDVRTRVEAAVQSIDRGGDIADARRELARLGGAALPFAIPSFDALATEKRKDLALSLAPIARRMGLAGLDEARDREHAVAFWTRFWDDRSIEFRRASVRSAVSRLVRYGSRGEDLVELNTFVLDDVLAALEPPDDAAGLARARALVEIAAHVTDRDDRILPDEGRYPGPESIAAARACVDRWQSYWAVYRSDFIAETGTGRTAGMGVEKR
jgi:peptide/nickel transport system permease protein